MFHVAFDPKPLIRTFEQALAQLETLSENLKAHESELLTAVRKAEIQHSQTLDHLGKKLDESIKSFQELDESLNPKPRLHGQSKSSQEGGIVAVKIGEKIANLDRQRKRALDSSFLVQCWIEASQHGDLTSLENLRRNGGGDGMVKCAIFAGQLMTMSKALDPLSWENYGAKTNGTGKTVNGVSKTNGEAANIPYNTRQLIEKFSETLEQDLLKSFDIFYRTQNFDAMRECATVLFDFNGGASVIANFVNQHQLFIDQNQVVGEEVTGEGEVWDKIVNPDADPPGVTPKFQTLIDEVRVVAKEESAIVKRAFPYYELVMSKFLQRVFQQSIQERLQDVLRKAEAISSIAFLRCLQASRSYIMALVDDLKTHGLTEHPEPISSQTSTVLDQQFDDLFVPYLVGASYMDRERKSLDELYSSLLFKFTVYHSRRKKLPTSVLGTWVASAKDAYIDRLHSSDLNASQKAMLLRVAGLKDSDSNKSQTDIEVTDQDGELSVAYAKRMLKWLAEAMGRRLELGASLDVPRDMSLLLEFLLNNMGEIYVETSLGACIDSAAYQESTLKSSTEPDLSYMTNVRAAASITQLMLTTISTVLVPLAASSLPTRRDMEKQASHAATRIEDRLNIALQRTTDLILAWVQRLLGQQKKTDFRAANPPGPSTSSSTSATTTAAAAASTGVEKSLAFGAADPYVESLATPTALAVCAFLQRSHGLLQSSLDGPNLRAATTELVLGCRTLLLEHFRRFGVSAAGGLMVTKDLSRYTGTLQPAGTNSGTGAGTGWEVEGPAKGCLEVLAEVGTMFVIGPEALRERLRDRGVRIGGIEREGWKPYLLRRDDAGSLAMQMVLQTM